ncbi:fasciclin domain-containing protein [Sphingobacterium chuzhouense]|uniref:Fasciclin domain-containing protein n=1 Tax=Sphingobacterium chuzhouense TaxID=1742264 RepID=A0ABR7XMS7_9SPHI|nr:fasciclin domain-containing protein [Sphingobacterium chuzhouense]MBD1420477.1 fasciclin domain-containing protein [Sphingobacterium chuzhouense]
MKAKKQIGRWSILIFLGWVLTWMSSCKDGFEDNTYTAYDETPIGLYLKNNADEYSLWVQVLEKANLYNTLNLDAIYTHFAPINAGVERYLKTINLGSVNDMTEEQAAYLVRYHLIPHAEIEFAQFQSGAINELNATDDNLFVEFRDGGLEAVYLNGVSRFNSYDIRATNGIIHSIDDVLVPLVETIYDRLEERQDWSLFRELVDLTGYREKLETVYTETTDPMGNPIQQRFKYTVFAVSNETYSKAGIQSLQDILDKLEVSAGGDYTDPNNLLNKYVGYHLLAQQRSYADLGQFPENVFKMNLQTMAINELVKVSESGAGLVLNKNEETQESISFLEMNIACKNGVVHEVNDWMPLFSPEQVEVIWEFTDYPDIEANVSQYRNTNLGSQYNKTFTASELTNIIWSARPEYKQNVLTYRNNRPTEGNWYNLLNHDHLRAELGESGWVEFKGPTIVKGKYKISFIWPSPKHSSNTGICAFVLDNEMLYPRLVISNSREERNLTQVLGTVDFTETTDHTLRILSLDGHLITMDRLQFDPVE